MDSSPEFTQDHQGPPGATTGNPPSKSAGWRFKRGVYASLGGRKGCPERVRGWVDAATRIMVALRKETDPTARMTLDGRLERYLGFIEGYRKRQAQGGGEVAQEEPERATGGVEPNGPLPAQALPPSRPVDPLLDLFDPLVFQGEPSWGHWRTFIKAMFALPPTDEDRVIFTQHTGRETWPTAPVQEVWLICGRGAGKSRIASVLALYLAIFGPRPARAIGESVVIPILASDKEQAQVIFRFVRETLVALPALRDKTVTREGHGHVEFANHVVLRVQAASFRGVRGPMVLAAFADEIAFWRSENSANPDYEILTALRPGLRKGGGGSSGQHRPLICLTTPYARRGEAWLAFKEHYGKDGDPVLVWTSDTRSMNPTFPEADVLAAYERDPAAAQAEYGGQFRSDIDTFLPEEVLARCVVPGRIELPWASNVRYVAFVDSAGGTGGDSMVLAIAHREPTGKAVLDCIREIKPPFSSEDAIAQLAHTLQDYKITKVTGDRYAIGFVIDGFRRSRITYTPSEQDRSDIYLAWLPMLTSGKAELLDLPRLLNQAKNLDRRTGAKGKDTIDHPPNFHDDVVNAGAGALVLAGSGEGEEMAGYLKQWISFRGGSPVSTPAPSPSIEGIPKVGRPRAGGGGGGGRAAGGAEWEYRDNQLR